MILPNKLLDDVTKEYLGRAVDSRMVSIISQHLGSYNKVIDIACGSGLYGNYLKSKAKKVYGIDYDPVLCKNASSTGAYDKVFCDKVENTKKYIKSVDAIFCSEFIEHVDNEDLNTTLNVLEDITNEKIIITVPNPLSPHFKYDPTHILQYSVRSLLKTLNRSNKYNYNVYPLGFSDYNLRLPIYRFLNIFSKKTAALSPTVLYVGLIKESKRSEKK